MYSSLICKSYFFFIKFAIDSFGDERQEALVPRLREKQGNVDAESEDERKDSATGAEGS